MMHVAPHRAALPTPLSSFAWRSCGQTRTMPPTSLPCWQPARNHIRPLDGASGTKFRTSREMEMDRMWNTKWAVRRTARTAHKWINFNNFALCIKSTMLRGTKFSEWHAKNRREEMILKKRRREKKTNKKQSARMVKHFFRYARALRSFIVSLRFGWFADFEMLKENRTYPTKYFCVHQSLESNARSVCVTVYHLW